MEPNDCRIHKLVADVCVVAEQRVLLVRYKDTSKYDNQSGWFLPDDFLAHLEHPETAAARILKEQVGIGAPQLTLSQIESFGNGWWHLIFHYRAQLEQTPDLQLSENIQAAKWFALAALPERAEVAHDGWALDVISQTLETHA